MFGRRKQHPAGPIASILLFILVISLFSDLFKALFYIVLSASAIVLAVLLARKLIGKGREKSAEKVIKAEEQQPETEKAEKKSYGPEIDPIIQEGNRALSEMGRLYMSIQDPEIRGKINELMRITDKIVQDAVEDPADIPQIKKFMNYYLPTTIKLLNSYDRMSAQGIEGENLNKSMKSINEMLDSAIEAYKKRLDSLFADQALDIETDIDVFNQMLAREGLSGKSDFNIK